jgi:hypothetical protein
MVVQHKHNTEYTLWKLDVALRQNWEAVKGKSDVGEQVPPAVLAKAGNDAQRARVLYFKLRLMQEFPMTFKEAQSPGGGLLPPRDAYVKALQGKTAGMGGPKKNLSWESSACLYLALSQDRGSKFNLDSQMTPREVVLDSATGLKYFVDDWGQPLSFYRWPYGNPEVTNPNVNPLPSSSSMTTGANDDEDPTGLLSATGAGWNPTSLSSISGMHPVGRGQSYKLRPAVASVGPDGLLGLDPTSMAPLAGKDWWDNLYSYRLRTGGRGD